MAVATSPARGESPTLESRLLAESPAALAAEAQQTGDPRRGAKIFFQPHLACAKCHAQAETTSPLGPDLTRLETTTTAEHVIESLLTPSKTIRDPYRPVVLELEDGTALTGLIVEDRPNALVIRDVGQGGRRRTLRPPEIATRETSSLSIMPAGQVNLLADRRQFLDLAAYLIEIAAKGPQRAAELNPPDARLVPPPTAPDTSGPAPQVYRTMLPESGPAALAIGLGRDVWVCFDPQRGGINYAWHGALDLSPTVAQKINLPAVVEGRLFYRDQGPGPLRVGDRERIPAFRFRGYRFVDDGVELDYQADAVRVRERLTNGDDDRTIVRRFEFIGPSGPVWLRVEPQSTAIVDVESAPADGDAWRIELPTNATVVMTLRAKEEQP